MQRLVEGRSVIALVVAPRTTRVARQLTRPARSIYSTRRWLRLAPTSAEAAHTCGSSEDTTRESI